MGPYVYGETVSSATHPSGCYVNIESMVVNFNVHPSGADVSGPNIGPIIGEVCDNLFCLDTDNGAVDNRGNACGQYSYQLLHCGSMDSIRFSSRKMCCACGGGTQMKQFEAFCVDYDNGARDSDGYDCSHYHGNPWSCGHFDVGRFMSERMCCACGGGRNRDEPFCVDTDQGLKIQYDVDLQRPLTALDGTEIVDCYGFAKDLGKCNTPVSPIKFQPKSMCCACGGGISEIDKYCVDLDPGEGDKFGYDCTYYTKHPFDCGWFDDASFSAKRLCCACGGGSADTKAPTFNQSSQTSAKAGGDAYGEEEDMVANAQSHSPNIASMPVHTLHLFVLCFQLSVY